MERQVIGTVSGSSISFGSKVTFGNSNVDHISILWLKKQQQSSFAYSNPFIHGEAIVGTVSGTSISFGSAAVFESANTQNISATFDSSNKK